MVVSLSFGMLCWGVCHQLRIPNASPNQEKWYGLFVFSSTLVTYNFQRLIKFTQLKSKHSDHMVWVFAHRKQLYFLVLIGSLLCGLSFFKIYYHQSNVLPLLIFSAIISFLYVVKIGNISLRERPHLKIHLIAIVSMIAIGFIRLINENNFNRNNWFFALAHYFYFVAITIPFDIRDLKFDSPSLRTIPQVFGIQKSRIISIGLFGLYLFILLLFKTTIYKNPAFIISCLLAIMLLLKTNDKRPDFYFSGIIESSIFIMGLSYLVV